RTAHPSNLWRPTGTIGVVGFLTAISQRRVNDGTCQLLFHACCGVVSNGCCDVSALRGAAGKLSPAPLPPPKPAIACTSCAFEATSGLAGAPVGVLAAKPPSCQSGPGAPKLADPTRVLPAMS